MHLHKNNIIAADVDVVNHANRYVLYMFINKLNKMVNFEHICIKRTACKIWQNILTISILSLYIVKVQLNLFCLGMYKVSQLYVTKKYLYIPEFHFIFLYLFVFILLLITKYQMDLNYVLVCQLHTIICGFSFLYTPSHTERNAFIDFVQNLYFQFCRYE